jgi:tRNA G26 N,N-dimethylase Trm1
MGQNQCRVQPFLSLVHHFLLRVGVEVSKQQLKDCLEVICEYNLWFPEEATLDEEAWE